MRILNLSGNFFFEEVNYKDYVIVYFLDLVYLDFRLIDEFVREVVTERYKYFIEELVYDEIIVRRK